ncbi:MAG: helix-turn-helix domain-containing protein [Oscillospiraceae bacterium]|nr:helix-turn-helix domain-containing protein [Oscillospiraceae bacterium]
MEQLQTGALIRALRKERGMTQRELAELLHVTDRAVSKWERNLGCPDVGLLPQLAQIFGVSMAHLLRGDLAPNIPEVGNMRRLKFYVCPECGNVLTATGGGELHCCGRRLEPLAPKPMDEPHAVKVEPVEEDWYVTFSHPMEKDHYFRFAAFVGTERVLLVRLYPEQGGEFRIPPMRCGKLYLCCSRHGLYEVKV